jgi:hypothetical protein
MPGVAKFLRQGCPELAVKARPNFRYELHRPFTKRPPPTGSLGSRPWDGFGAGSCRWVGAGRSPHPRAHGPQEAVPELICVLVPKSPRKLCYQKILNPLITPFVRFDLVSLGSVHEDAPIERLPGVS